MIETIGGVQTGPPTRRFIHDGFICITICHATNLSQINERHQKRHGQNCSLYFLDSPSHSKVSYTSTESDNCQLPFVLCPYNNKISVENTLIVRV